MKKESINWLKIASVGLGVLGAIVTVVGGIVDKKNQSVELDLKVNDAVTKALEAK